jgi:hypothetical protein
MFRKMDKFTTSGEKRETPTLSGTLKRANLNRHVLTVSPF